MTWFSKLRFKNRKCVDVLHFGEFYKQEKMYDRPVCIGCSVLDLSKLHNDVFYYGVVYANDQAESDLVYSDTDSLVNM